VRNTPDPFGATALAAITGVDVVSREVALRDLANEPQTVVLEGFFNQRCVFLLARPRTLLRFGCRVQIVRTAI
jgi:hypothetical protein